MRLSANRQSSSSVLSSIKELPPPDLLNLQNEISSILKEKVLETSRLITQQAEDLGSPKDALAVTLALNAEQDEKDKKGTEFL